MTLFSTAAFYLFFSPKRNYSRFSFDKEQKTRKELLCFVICLPTILNQMTMNQNAGLKKEKKCQTNSKKNNVWVLR